MKFWRFFLLFVAVGPLNEGMGTIEQDNGRAKSKDQKTAIDIDCFLEKKEGSAVHFSSIELGHVAVGSTVRINAKLINPFDHSIRISGVSDKCVCRQAKLENTVIEPNSSGQISFDIEIPARKKSKKVESRVTLVHQGTSVIHLDILYHLKGLLAFESFMSIVRFEGVSELQKELEIPLLVTEPVNWKKIKVETSDNLEGISTKIQQGPHGPLVRATIPVEILRNGNLRGELTVSNTEGHQIDSYLLSIKDSRVHEISPDVLVFKKLSDGKFRATAIVEIAGFSDTEEAVHSARPRIGCLFGDQPLVSEVKLLTGSTYRVTVHADDLRTGAEDEVNGLVWEIFNGIEALKIKQEFIFEN